MPQPPQTTSLRLTRRDYAGMLAGFLLTLAITVVNSRGRLFWEDEMLGWMLLRDPSWAHMIHAWKLGADGGGFSFYLLGRGWFALLGASPLTFRLFSSVCFGLAFAVTWSALRRVYPTWIVALATTDTWFFSPPFTLHMIEGRFYGLLVLATALGMWLVLILADTAPDSGRIPLRLYLATFATHAVLTTTHVLGAVYSLFLLLATVALDLHVHRRRPALYLTIATAWLLLIPERTALRAAAAVGKPHFWTKAPTVQDVLGAYTGYSNEILLALLLLAAIAAFALRRHPGAFRQAFQDRRPAYIVTFALFCVPLAFVAIGLQSTWLFTDRYLLPLTVGVAYLTAELLCLASRNPVAPSTGYLPRAMNGGATEAAIAAATALYLAFLLFWDFHHVARFTPTHPDYTAELAAHLPHDLPVVCEDAFTFTELMQQQHSSGVPYRFLLDWPQALNPSAPRMEVTQYHLMENWRKAGYFADAIQDAAPFLAQHPRFLVIHAGPPGPEIVPPEIGNPIAARLAHNPAYQVRPIYTLDRLNKDTARDTVWLVCRGACG